MRLLLLVSVLMVGCVAETSIQTASPPLSGDCTVAYRVPEAWNVSGRLLWFSPRGIAPVQMGFDDEAGATIAIEFRRKDESDGLERDALRDARQFGNGTASVTFASDYRQNPRRVSQIVVEYEGNENQRGVWSKATYRSMCGGTVAIVLRYGKNQSSSVKNKWKVAEATILTSLTEVRLK